MFLYFVDFHISLILYNIQLMHNFDIQTHKYANVLNIHYNAIYYNNIIVIFIMILIPVLVSTLIIIIIIPNNYYDI